MDFVVVRVLSASCSKCKWLHIKCKYTVTTSFLLKLKNQKNQLDATYYFIVLLLGSTCFGHYYAHHQELATVMLITTLQSCFSLQSGHYSSLTAPNLQPTANQERNDQCGNQHHSRELLMMGMVMLETCWAYKRQNKIYQVTSLFFSYHNDARCNKHQNLRLPIKCSNPVEHLHKDTR